MHGGRMLHLLVPLLSIPASGDPVQEVLHTSTYPSIHDEATHQKPHSEHLTYLAIPPLSIWQHTVHTCHYSPMPDGIATQMGVRYEDSISCLITHQLTAQYISGKLSHSGISFCKSRCPATLLADNLQCLAYNPYVSDADNPPSFIHAVIENLFVLSIQQTQVQLLIRSWLRKATLKHLSNLHQSVILQPIDAAPFMSTKATTSTNLISFIGNIMTTFCISEYFSSFFSLYKTITCFIASV
ncbi:hypothetical protein KP509_24G068700 [Ceratopteris richardii]|uniref:Apple domain-containing protein n=1 Tax=Ceratopteris richardii TaxID=49495 RepID=A0A8T2RVH9_CERRI|nr:hypothetical protein KP509_24G068700 [Ceratopteris richardii]